MFFMSWSVFDLCSFIFQDESEAYRKMVMETITKVVASLGASDIDERLEVRLVDGIIYSFQEQTTEDQVMLDGFGTVVNALGTFLIHVSLAYLTLYIRRRPC